MEARLWVQGGPDIRATVEPESLKIAVWIWFAVVVSHSLIRRLLDLVPLSLWPQLLALLSRVLS
jgi:hypothetical protein